MLLPLQNIYLGIKDVLSFCTEEITLLLRVKNNFKVFFFRQTSICATVV